MLAGEDEMKLPTKASVLGMAKRRKKTGFTEGAGVGAEEISDEGVTFLLLPADSPWCLAMLSYKLCSINSLLCFLLCLRMGLYL